MATCVELGGAGLPAMLLGLLLCCIAAVGASADDMYSERTLHIARQLNCPICAGESVADSQSELARQMRGIIEQKVQAGESRRSDH